MKKIAVIFSLLLLLCSCDGSDDYQGTWKALDSKGKKFEIIFEARLFSIIDSTRTIKNYPYTQHSFKHKIRLTLMELDCKMDEDMKYSFLKMIKV
jgi:hypothetical protein